MIQLFFMLLAVEGFLVVALLFKTPLQSLAILGIDYLRCGRGPVMVRTVAGTFLVVLGYSVYNMVNISRHLDEVGGGALTLADQLLMHRYLLETYLIGYSLFLALIVYQFQHYIRELLSLRKSIEASMKQNTAFEESISKEISILRKSMEAGMKAFEESTSKEISILRKSMEAGMKQNKTFEESTSKEISIMRKNMEASMKQNRASEESISKEINILKKSMEVGMKQNTAFEKSTSKEINIPMEEAGTEQNRALGDSISKIINIPRKSTRKSNIPRKSTKADMEQNYCYRSYVDI